MIFRWGTGLLYLVAVMARAELSANQPAPADIRSDYLVDQWQTDDGLPQNSATSIAQTPDGYLWFSTFNGLVRFDGVRFTVFDSVNTPELASSRLTKIFVDGHGALWIISEFGDLARLAEGRFTHLTSKDGLPSGGVSCVGEDGSGNLWISSGRNEGCYRFEDGRFALRLKPQAALATSSVFAFIPTQEGGFWGAQLGCLIRIAPGEPAWYLLDINKAEALVETMEQTGSLRRLRGVCRCRDGGLWILAGDGLRKLRAGHWAKTIECPIMFARSLYEDSQGNVWVGTPDDGLYRFDAQGGIHRYKFTTDVKDEPVVSMYEDKEGNLWMGTDGAGLYRVKQRAFKTYGSKDGLPMKVVKSVTEDQEGKIWAVNPGKITWFPGQQPPGVNPTNLNIAGAWCSMADSDGAVWIGSYGDGLFRCERGTATQLSMPAGKRYVPIFTLFQDRSGTVWAGGDEGLFRAEGNGLVRVEPSPAPKKMDVRAMAEDHSGRLYVGLNGGGLLGYQAGQWTQYSERDGLAGDAVWSLCVDKDDTVWIGTYGGGLSCYAHGRFFNFSAAHLQFPGFITAILEDGLGYLWLASNRGLYRASLQELNEVAAGRRETVEPMSYSKADGLGAIEFSSVQPAAWKARDGRIWFATVGGLSVVDPAHLPFNPLPPLMATEEVVVDDVPVARKSESVTVPPGSHRLEIHFTALSLTAPDKVRFKYQLEGFDPKWVEAGGRRTAYFTSVAPGQYWFHVKASNNDGVWNDAGATLGVIVLPYFWQTWWFQSLAAAALLGLIFLGFRARLARLQRAHAAQARFARQLIDSQEQERKRIAGELHDSLGQNLLLLKNRALMGLRQPGVPPGIADQFQQISDGASGALEEVRATAFALRPYELDRLGLSKAAESMIQKVAATSVIKFSTDLDEVGGPLPGDVEINLYRILQEAINNALKHSGATSVIVEIKREPPVLRVSVLDDGRGFDAAGGQVNLEQKNGFGLKGIAERVKLIGGVFEAQSAAGKGTRITVTVPLPANHQDSAENDA
jgi:signal transduction histidine kinase/ligand-binding sensor domain-containing protein